MENVSIQNWETNRNECYLDSAHGQAKPPTWNIIMTKKSTHFSLFLYMYKNDRKCINETMKRDVVLGLANQLRAVEYFSKTNFFSFPIGTMTCKNQRPHCYIPPMRSRHVRIMLVSLLHFHQTPLEKQKKRVVNGVSLFKPNHCHSILQH